jgi:acetyltransferase-like isoleucine patch superfamily enzyme
MKEIIKRFLLIACRYSKIVNRYYKEWGIIGALPIGLIIANFFFQRILGINKKMQIPVNFTSRLTSIENIHYYKDKNTVLSFAASGGSYIQAINGIRLGRNVLFATGVKLISANHDIKDHSNFVRTEPISIGDNVWLGTGVIILPGVKIGNNCVIGAGSVVTKSFNEDNLIIAGNPAKIISKR